MKNSVVFRILQVSALSLLSTQVYAQTTSATATATSAAAAGPIQTLGCYKSVGNLTQDNTNTFQTDGLCQSACTAKNDAVMAITGGSTCYCGNIIPGLDQEVDSSKCNSPCNGFGQKTCGGLGYWQLYLTGLTGDVETAANATSSSSSSASSSHSSAPTVASTAAAQTVVVTASSSPLPSSSSSGGPNKIGIAVGVVLGVVAIAALIGGIFFFMRQKKIREIEEEHKRNAAVNSFVTANKSAESKSTNDSRLDPSVYTHRRESIGSIADEMDFSRRILQVRNPDRSSQLSNMA